MNRAEPDVEMGCAGQAGNALSIGGGSTPRRQATHARARTRKRSRVESSCLEALRLDNILHPPHFKLSRDKLYRDLLLT